MRTNRHRSALAKAAAFLGAALFTSAAAWGQGCIASHNEQPVISGLTPDTQSHASGVLHGLTATVGFRFYNSFRHFSGEKENVSRALLHTQIKNHVDQFDLNLNYQLTPRWSLTADIPGMEATRNQLYPPKAVFQTGGIGDVTVGAQAWVFRPPTESHGNVALAASLKLPTGINNAMGTATLADGTVQKVVADQSIQPGDGSWGFTLATQAYHPLPLQTMGYFTGAWTFNPRDTNGVLTFRAQKYESVMSVPDEYLWRGGLSRNVPRVRGLALSLGGRMEGVPVRDAFGASNGFRRPGYIISLEPGLMYQRNRNIFSVSGPWAMERNRKKSTSDIKNGTHGDAAFADYTVIASYTRIF